jgi:pterin-4a-carbinolamine dehydratase
MTTMTKRAAKLVAAEDAKAHRDRIERRAVQLQREATLEKVKRDQARAAIAAAHRVAEFLEHAPVVTLEYGPVRVVIKFAGRDGLEMQTIHEAVRRATNELTKAFNVRLGQVRLGNGKDVDLLDHQAIENLKDELRFAARMGAVEIEVAP